MYNLMRKFESVSDDELELIQDFLGLPWGSTDRSRNATRRSLTGTARKGAHSQNCESPNENPVKINLVDFFTSEVRQ